MSEIVTVHHPRLMENLLTQALNRFYELREIETLRKKPSTSELIDWLQALIVAGVTAEELEEKMPFLGVLLKKESDVDAYVKRHLPGAGSARMRYA